MYYPIVLRPGILDRILIATPPLPPHPTPRAQPQKPDEPSLSPAPLEVERCRGRYFYYSCGIGLAFLAFLLFPGLIGGFGFIVLTLVAATDPIYFYKIRLQRYRLKLKQYQENYINWLQEKEEWEKNGALRIREWKEICQGIEYGWRRDKIRDKEQFQLKCRKIMLPENIQKWRFEEILRAPKIKPTFVESDAVVGKLDDKIYDALKTNFPELNILKGKKIIKAGEDWGYTPDVIIQDLQTNIWLDIEIDEPWYRHLGIKVPSHFIGKDDNRNQFFNSQGWVVLRLSECQFFNHPESCMKQIAQELDRFRLGSIEKLENRFLLTPDLPKVSRWTEEEATQIPRHS